MTPLQCLTPCQGFKLSQAQADCGDLWYFGAWVRVRSTEWEANQGSGTLRILSSTKGIDGTSMATTSRFNAFVWIRHKRCPIAYNLKANTCRYLQGWSQSRMPRHQQNIH